jgi:hypothetical protein
MSKAAALLAWVTGLGSGLPCIYGTWYLADRGHTWIFMGFPTYGGGPFESIGVETTVRLLVMFLLVCVAEMVAGCCGADGARAPSSPWRYCRSSSLSGSVSPCRWARMPQRSVVYSSSAAA